MSAVEKMRPAPGSLVEELDASVCLIHQTELNLSKCQFVCHSERAGSLEVDVSLEGGVGVRARGLLLPVGHHDFQRLHASIHGRRNAAGHRLGNTLIPHSTRKKWFLHFCLKHNCVPEDL